MKLKRPKSVEGPLEEEEEVVVGRGSEEGEEARMPRSRRLTRQKLRRKVRRMNQPATEKREEQRGGQWSADRETGRESRWMDGGRGKQSRKINTPTVMRKNESHSDVASPRKLDGVDDDSTESAMGSDGELLGSAVTFIPP